MSPAQILIVAVVAGVLCAMLCHVMARQKGLEPGGYALAGLLLGVIGVVITALAQPRPQLAPGWYPDPWRQGDLRWYDGRQWTASVHGPS